MKPRTILHTIEAPGPGGAETVLLQLACGLDPAKFRSVALVPEGGWLHHNLRERAVPMRTFRSPSRGEVGLWRNMARQVRLEGADLIQSHLPDQNFSSCVVGRWLRVPIVVTYHGQVKCERWKDTVKLGWVRRSCSAAVAVSQTLADALVKAGFPPERIERIYNGVDLSRYAGLSRGELRAELGCTNGTKLIGMVANLRKDKGHEFFLKAAERIAHALPDTHFVTVGDMDEAGRRQLSPLLESPALSGRLSCLGFRSDIPAILADLDVFVLPSVSEGFSLATVEAMAAGKPVVVTRSGGPQEIVEEGVSGFLVPPADANALADTVCRVLREPDSAQSVGRAARLRVEQLFSRQQMVHEYEDLYTRLLGGSEP